MIQMINLNRLKTGVTYIFEGNSSTSSAIFIPFSNSYLDYGVQMANRLFVYNGTTENSTFVGTLARWRSSLLPFKQIAIHNVGYKNPYRQESKKSDLLVFLNSSSLEDFVQPSFIQFGSEEYHKLDATEGATSLTTLQSPSNKDCSYRIRNFDVSKDVELVLLDGFPRLDYNETEIIGRFNSSNLDRDWTLLLSGEKSFILLRGRLSFKIDNSFEDFSPQPVLKIFARGGDSIEGMTWFVGDGENQQYSMNVTLEKTGENPSARLVLQIISDNHSQNNTVIYPEKNITNRNGRRFYFRLNGIVNMRAEFTNITPEQAETTAPTPTPTTTRDYLTMVRTAFYRCFKYHNGICSWNF